ncbi:MAG: hypothetical protein Q8N73_01305 [bacterium]|nr:hypothetical protein [bacterium]
MKKYALRVDDPILYFKKESALRTGDEIVLKRSQVKSWGKDTEAIDNLFLKKGKSEKIRDGDVGNYEIKFKIRNEISLRAIESVLGSYQGFSADIV